MSTLTHWRGLKDLLQDAVSHGADAMKKIQLETARRPFEILEQVPPLATPVKAVHAVHTAVVAATHGCIQVATLVVGAGLDVAIDVAEKALPEAKE